MHPLQVLKPEALSHQWISSVFVVSDFAAGWQIPVWFVLDFVDIFWSRTFLDHFRIALVWFDVLPVCLRQVFLKVINSHCFQICCHTLRCFCLSKTEASRFYIFKTTPWFMCIHKQPLTLFEGHWEVVNLFRKSKVGDPSARQKTSFRDWVSVCI